MDYLLLLIVLIIAAVVFLSDLCALNSRFRVIDETGQARSIIK